MAKQKRITLTHASRFDRRSVALMLAIAALTAGLGYVVVSSFAATSGPLAGAKLYNDMSGPSVAQAAAWRTSRPADAAQIDKIANRPKAVWMGGWTSDVKGAANALVTKAAASGTVAQIVAYDIPGRDCGSYSAGGASSHAGYRTWVDNMAAGIGARKAVVILEPDAVPQWDCLDGAGKQARIDSLKYAVNALKTKSQAVVYIDAGGPGWLGADDNAGRLNQVAIAQADGFALNTSNFATTNDVTAYGTQISAKVGGKHFVIDTSRNGLGSNGQWCNPAGRALGEEPSTATRSNLVDAYLWVKGPGESDGTCNGGPAAGTWWPDYALGLAQRANLAVATPAPTATPTPTPTPTVVLATPTPTPTPAAVGAGTYNDSLFTYTGVWSVGDNTGAAKYQGDDHYTNAAGAGYSFRFTGAQARMYATTAPMHGVIAVSVDGGAETLVDLYAAARRDQVLAYATPALAGGVHILRVRVTGTRSSKSSDGFANADRIDVLATAAATPGPTMTPTPVVTPGGSTNPADTNGDGRVNVLDLSALLSKWGTTDAKADVNRDGRVNVLDLSAVLSKWGA